MYWRHFWGNTFDRKNKYQWIPKRPILPLFCSLLPPPSRRRHHHHHRRHLTLSLYSDLFWGLASCILNCFIFFWRTDDPSLSDKQLAREQILFRCMYMYEQFWRCWDMYGQNHTLTYGHDDDVHFCKVLHNLCTKSWQSSRVFATKGTYSCCSTSFNISSLASTDINKHPILDNLQCLGYLIKLSQRDHSSHSNHSNFSCSWHSQILNLKYSSSWYCHQSREQLNEITAVTVLSKLCSHCARE